MKGLKITIVRGRTTDRKKEYFFDHQRQYVVIGCDPEACDISFLEEYRDTGVGNEHIAFKRSLGRYQIDLNTDHYVSVNGEVPFEDQEITGTATLQLGEEVVIEIEVIDRRKQPRQTRGKNPQPGEQIKKTKKYLLASFVVIVVLLTAAVYFNGHIIGLESNIQVSDENIQRVTDRLKDLSFTLDTVEKQADSIARETIDNISKSVYLVLVRNSSGGEQPAGTAWVIEGGRLATNAHVADSMEDLKPNEEMVVRSPVAPYRTHVVKDILLHPGYESYLKIWNDYLPCQKVGSKLTSFRTIHPADVAILYPEDAEELNPPLPLADMDELASIDPGMKVAFVGYPSESLLPGNNKKPAPVAQQDEIIRITDFFQTRQIELPNRLIHHGLPITGGASGSPMFNSDGKVIGIISSMNVTSLLGSRAPNAADVNFGQRIDFLFDLVGQDLDARVAELKSQWQKSLGEYLPGFETSNEAVMNGVAEIFSVGAPASHEDISFGIDWGDDSDDYVRVRETISVDAPGLYLLLLKPKYMAKKFTLSSPGNKNITVCAPEIDFSDYATYAFILASEPGEVTAAFRVYEKDDEKIQNSQFDLIYWDEDLDVMVDAFIRYTLAKVNGGNEIEVVKKVENQPMVGEINDVFVAGFEMELQEKGLYIFSSVPIGPGEVDIAILDENDKTIEGDKDKNGSGIVPLENASGKKKINFISYSSNKDVVQNMTVYFSPLQEK